MVAAGTLGFNELLLRCRDQYKSLPDLSPSFGNRFSGNGDFLLAATVGADAEVDPERGPSITAGADFSTGNNKIYIEDLGFPDPFIWMLEGMIPNRNRLAIFCEQERAISWIVWGSVPGRSTSRPTGFFAEERPLGSCPTSGWAPMPLTVDCGLREAVSILIGATGAAASSSGKWKRPWRA